MRLIYAMFFGAINIYFSTEFLAIKQSASLFRLASALEIFDVIHIKFQQLYHGV